VTGATGAGCAQRDDIEAFLIRFPPRVGSA
jgi:hypothetical protein